MFDHEGAQALGRIGAGLVKWLARVDIPLDFIRSQDLEADIGRYDFGIVAVLQQDGTGKIPSAPDAPCRSKSSAWSGLRLWKRVCRGWYRQPPQWCPHRSPSSGDTAPRRPRPWPAPGCEQNLPGLVSGMADSSKLLGMTVNATPACFSRYRRRGDLDARMRNGESVDWVMEIMKRSFFTNPVFF